MAVAVVDTLEPVEIEHEDSDVVGSTDHWLQAPLQVIEEHRPVRKTGERVVECLVGQLLSREMQLLGQLLRPVSTREDWF